MTFAEELKKYIESYPEMLPKRIALISAYGALCNMFNDCAIEKYEPKILDLKRKCEAYERMNNLRKQEKRQIELFTNELKRKGLVDNDFLKKYFKKVVR